MELDTRKMRMLAMILIALALLMPLVFAFEGIGTAYSVNKTTIGVSGDAGTGYYSARFTTTHQQPGSYPAQSDQYTANIGWYDATRGNLEPNITQIYIRSSSGQNLSTDKITCYVNATDPDNTTLTVYYHWYNNSVQIPSLSGQTTIISDIATNISTIDQSNTTAEENWTCEAKTWDGYYNETDWNNASIIIKALPAPPGGAAGPTIGMPGGVVREKISACVESWTCTSWSPCVDNIKTRICIDYNNCGTEENKPITSMTCEEAKPEEKPPIPEKPSIEEPKISVGSAIKTAAYGRLDKTVDKIIGGISYIIQGVIKAITAIIETIIDGIAYLINTIIKAITAIIETIIDLILTASKALIAWMTYDNINFALLILIYILLILTSINALTYFLRQYKTGHRSRELIKRIYTLLEISIISVTAHFALFQQELWTAYIATITMITIMALDLFLKKEPIRLRRKERAIEKVKSYQEYLKETERLSDRVDRFLTKAPAKPEEIDTLTKADKFRFTRMKNVIRQLQEGTRKPLTKLKSTITLAKVRREIKRKEKEKLQEQKRLEKQRKADEKTRAKEIKRTLKEAKKLARIKLKPWTREPIKIKPTAEDSKYTKTKKSILEIIQKTKQATTSELDKKIQEIKEEQKQKRILKEKAKEKKELFIEQKKIEKQGLAKQKQKEKQKARELHKKLQEARKLAKETEKELLKKSPIKIKHALTRIDEGRYDKIKRTIQGIVIKTDTTTELDKEIQQIKEEQARVEQQRKLEQQKQKEQKKREEALHKKLQEARKLAKDAGREISIPIARVRHILTRQDKTRYDKTKEIIRQILQKPETESELDRQIEEIKRGQEQKRRANARLREQRRIEHERKLTEKQKLLEQQRKLAEKQRKQRIKQKEERKIERELKTEQKQRAKEKQKLEKEHQLGIWKKEQEKQRKQRIRQKEERKIERELKAEQKQRAKEKQKLEQEHQLGIWKKEQEKQRKQRIRQKEERKIERELKKEQKRRKEAEIRKQEEQKILEEEQIKQREKINEQKRKQHEKEIKKLSEFNKELKTYLHKPKIKKKKHKTRFEILAEKVRALEKD